MPFWPPASSVIGKFSCVGRVAGVKVSVVAARRSKVNACWLKGGLFEIDRDKEPTGAESSFRSIGDEEETIFGSLDGDCEGRS